MTFPVTRSLLSVEALAHEVAAVYPIEQPVACVLLRSLTNDVYHLTTQGDAYIVKVYGAGWRSVAEIEYELDVLSHLTRKGVPVATALVRRDGQRLHTLQAPEGTRCLVLFAHAGGTKPERPFSAALYARFGQQTARLHAATDDFTSTHPRPARDLAHLVDQPLAVIGPHLAHRPQDWADVVELAARVRRQITALAPRLNWGVCHGDVSLDNIHQAEDGMIIFYDFDSGGPGWRACDLYGVRGYSPFWEDYVRGYRDVRPLGAADLAAVPSFVVAEWLANLGWAMSVWARRDGIYRVDDAYITDELTRMRHWVVAHLHA